jgi:Zn-dependent metalloprotease
MVLTLLFLFQTVAGHSSRSEPANGKATVMKQVPVSESGIDRLLADTNGNATVTINDVTQVASFVRLPAGSLDLPAAPDASPEEKARLFFQQYKDAFGLQDVDSDLLHLSTKRDAADGSHVSFQQMYQGVPVFAAILRVHFDSDGQLTAVNGTFLPKINLNVIPQLSADAAAGIAVNTIAASNLIIAKNTLQIFRTGLAQGIAGTDHLVYEVEVTDRSNIRDFFFIDAHTGTIVERVNGINDALFRRIYDGGYGPGFITWEEGDAFPTADVDINNIISGTGESYDLFFNAFGFDAYDGAGSDMEAVNDDPTISCPNANWNGVSTNYCTDVTGDDTVAHEWGHAYTEYTHNLIYQWQPGALNEAYSDIWGEVVDFINNRGTDTPGGLRSDGSCSLYGAGLPSVDDTYRWLSGEDDPAFGGAIRDMWHPACYNDPGKVSDTTYWCTAGDGGGVHTNSGIPNHAFALLVDGGTYNSVTVNGIGLTKAAHIYWQAQSVYQTPTTDFSDHADALEASCTDLINVNLNDLSTGAPSGEIISAADCTELGNALAAVEMRDEPLQCNFQPMLDPNPPLLCGGTLTTIFTDTFEIDPTSSWTISHMDVYSTTDLNWEWVSTLPDGRPGSAFFAVDPQIGSCSAGPGDVSGVMHTDSPTITIPADVVMPGLTYVHWIASEMGWDGGNLKISVNGGPWQVVASEDYTFNPYNTTLQAAPANTNPLAGEPGFSGTDGGEISGSWYESRVDLSAYAGPNDVVQLRFDFGMDGCTGLVGWYVDDVHVYSCSQPIISVEPPDVSSTQLPDTVVTQTLTINNLGDENLDWTIFEDASSQAPAILLEGEANGSPERQVPTSPVLPNTSVSGSAFSGGIVADGSFEAGSPNPSWNESSTNFGTPLCTIAGCTAGGGTGPHSGSWWAWFGGINASETGSVDQDVTIPVDSTSLSFWLEIPAADNPGFLNVEIDNNVVFSVTQADTATYATYTEVIVDISAFADGSSHNLEFYSEVNPGTNVTNFFVDDVAITPPGAVACDTPEDIPWLSVSPASGTTGPTSSSPVDLVFDSTGYSTGVYSGTLCIDSNDAATPQVSVPVTMTVVAAFPPEIAVDPGSLAANLAADNVTTQTLTISNVGDDDLDWTIDEAPSPAIQAATPSALTSRPGSLADPSLPLSFRSLADFSEGFDDITNLPGWAMQNNPDTPGTIEWFQGNPTVFAAHAGAANAYIAANFNNTGGSQISNWLMTPEIAFSSSAQISFWTRTVTASGFPDRLQVRVSTNGASTDVGSTPSSVGDFTNLELDINETLALGGYPEVWTQFTVDLSAYAGQSGRVAFRYYVPTSAGPTGANSNYIGIDTVEFTEGVPTGCDAPTDIGWLAASPTAGTTSSGNSSIVDVVFDSAGLSTGTYTATLCVNSNDLVTPLVEVPVTLTVGAPSFNVSIAPDAAITGTAGTTVTYTLHLTNTGNAADTFDLAVGGNTWTTTLSDSTVSLGVGVSATLIVTVDIPAGAADGQMDTATVTATSQGDGAVSGSATLVTTAVAAGPSTLYLPVVIKD